MCKNKKKLNSTKLATEYVVRVAILAALLTALKFAISFIPNIEVVTILIMVYGASLGITYALPVTLIFCSIEIAIYGVASWTILYFVYWPLLAVVSSLLLRNKNLIVAFFIGVVATVLFGVISACADTLLCVNELSNSDLEKYWVAYYLRGVSFDIIHLVSNAIIIPVLFKPLCKVIKVAAPTAYISSNIKIKKILAYELEFIRLD